MDAQQFLADFGHISHAPNGLAKLRELVLVLAMQGRLLQQVPGEDAASLLEVIDKEKQSLIASRALRSPKPLPVVTDKDRPYRVPATWCWTRFGEIALHNSGKTLDSVRNSGQPRPYITTSNLYWGRFDLSNVRQMLIRDEELEKCTARKGDLLICEGGEAGRAAVWVSDQEVCFQNHVHRARFLGNINPFYAYRFFEKLSLTGEINEHRKGIGISNMSSKALAMLPFPLPPLEEQERIVGKINELMSLFDQLGKQQQSLRKRQNALRQSTLQALASAESPLELQTNWQRLQSNFGNLFSEPEDVRAFKGLVLDLAVNGRFFIPSREPVVALELLDQIAAARSKWEKTAENQEKKEAVAMAKKIRTQHATAPAVPLPSHWCWASMLQVSQVIIDCDHKTPVYSADGVHLVRTTDIRDGKMLLRATKKVSEDVYQQRSRRLAPRAEDIFLTREAPMGEAAMVPRGERVGLGQRLMLIRVFSELFNPQYLLYVMQSPSFKERLMEAAVGMTVKHINVSDVENLQIPVPPKGEQDRIVEMLDQLFECCALYTHQLSRARKTAATLALSAVAALSGITVKYDEDTTVKAPQTELIAPLCLATPPDVKAQAPLASILSRNKGKMAARDLWQRFGGEVDAFYAQLKIEVAHGWIAEPEVAQVLEKPAAEAAKA
ncbi:Type I restriction modification DNA specificity domain protein [Xanthomonas sp. SS]|uniref:restriction endonuclease subunit S n=1 Tax=Xanthomonas sp. SS TaxID=2724122 RepID=UPI00163B03D9|nr:restriction endonuclease subunit S [Xanthomonas sp. SS]QNH17842.1 Type I restriction modification DNA specificity domain protein [Xanthomonas sp. SS]